MAERGGGIYAQSSRGRDDRSGCCHGGERQQCAGVPDGIEWTNAVEHGAKETGRGGGEPGSDGCSEQYGAEALKAKRRITEAAWAPRARRTPISRRRRLTVKATTP